MVELDGALGEGGGQILRTALALSMLRQTPLTIQNIRANRSKPGLRRQHLAAVHAAARLSGAFVRGAVEGSQELYFNPGPLQAGVWNLDIGSAGSTTLVLQTLLPAMLAAPGETVVEIVGGTHNPLAPPATFIERVFVPLLRQMGADIEVETLIPGFYPRGGGRLRAVVRPSTLRPLRLGRPYTRRLSATVLLVNLPTHIALRETEVLRAGLGAIPVSVEQPTPAVSVGNAVWVEIQGEDEQGTAIPELVCALGERGVPAEAVAGRAVEEVRSFLSQRVPVGEHLADQLLLPLALAGGGSYLTGPLSLHTLTNMEVIRRFTGQVFMISEQDGVMAVRL